MKRLFPILLALFFGVVTSLFAAAPSGGYVPGNTLDPDCAPGDSDCIVRSLEAQDEGTSLTSNALVFNFTGAGVTATESAGTVTVNISGGGGGGGITSLNGLSGATQTFATGTSGTDFSISSSGTAHTFNIPDAGASARGLVTTGTQTFAGNKTFSGDVTIDVSGYSATMLLGGEVLGGDVGLYGNGSTRIATFYPGDLKYIYGDGVINVNASDYFVGIGAPDSFDPDARLDVFGGGPNGAMRGKMGYNSPSTLSFAVYGEQDGGSASTGLSVWDDNTATLYGFYSADGNARNYFAGATSIGGSTPDASAILDISSTTQGLLAPRMSEAERDAIGSPATGLFVYNTDTNAFNFYDGSAWTVVGSGGSSLIGSTTTLGNETWLGSQAGNGTGSTVYTVFLGEGAGNDAQTADHSIFIGEDAGAGDGVDNTGGGSSILIGNNTSTGGFSDSIAIGQGATNTASNQFLLADAYTQMSLRGVNYTLPSADGTSSQVLTTDGAGGLTWQDAAGGGSQWLLNGSSELYYTASSVGIGNTDPNDSAILDLASTTQGLLAPRMTEAERDLIGTPATGLLVYNTDTNAFNFYDGSAWGAIGGGAGLVLFNENYVDVAPLAVTGPNAIAIGGYSVGAGYDTSTTGSFGNDSIAIGLNARANADRAIAISTGADDASGQATASGTASVAIGSGTASGTMAVSLLRGIASGDSSFAVGNGTASGPSAIALNGTASGNNSVSIGDGAYARASGEVSIGDGTDYTPDGNNDRVFNVGDDGSDLFTVSKLYGNIGIRNTAPDVSAALDIASTSRGLLTPRMSEAQRDAIGTPATGLLVYNTDTNVFNYYDGSAWGGIGGAVNTLATPSGSSADGGSISGTTLTLSIADATNPGLLSASNWTTFNNKLSTAVISLGGLTGATQTFATGTAGSDFSISSSGTTHTFNIPDASATARGLVTTGTQTLAGAKTFTSLLTGSAGAAFSGAAVNINASSNFATNIGTGTSNGAVSIGGNSNTLAINTSSWDVSSAGAVTGLTGLSMASGNFAQVGTGTFSTGTGTVSLNGNTTVSSSNTFTVGTGASTFGGSVTVSTMTAGSVLFAGTSGVLTQDNANLFYDNTNDRLGIGTVSPITQLHVSGKTPSSNTSSVSIGTDPLDIAVQDKYAYVVNFSSNTLQSINISNAASPAVVGSVSITTPSKIVVRNRYAYVISLQASTLTIIDVSNPASPAVVGSVSTGTNPSSLVVAGRYAYIANSTSNTLQVVDVSNPASPAVVGSFATNTAPLSLAVAGTYVYIYSNDTNKTLQIVDASNPALPVSAGSVSTTMSPGSITIQGSYVYVVSVLGYVRIYNIADPASITLVGTLNTGLPYTRVKVSGRYIYVTSNNDTIEIIDVSDPASPVTVGSIALSGNPVSLEVQGRYVYVPLGSNVMQIFDIGGAYIQQFESGGIVAGSLAVHNGINAMMGNFTGGLNVGSTLNVYGSESIYSANTAVDVFTITANSLTTANALSIVSASTGAASNTQTGLNISLSGANATSTQTTFGGRMSNTHTGTSSTNIGLSLSASGGTNNYALRLATNTSCTGTNALQTDASGNVACGSTVSDESVKNVGADYTMNALDQINGLTIKHFTYKTVEEGGNPFADDGGVEHIGFIAQNVQDVIPWGVHTVDFDGNTEPILALDPIAIQAITVKALQDLNHALLDIENGAPLSMSPVVEGDSFGVSFFKNLTQKIATWLADTANSITSVIADKIEARNQVCVNGECFTAEDIQALKALIPGGGSVSDEEPTPEPEPETPPVDEGTGDALVDEPSDPPADVPSDTPSDTPEPETPPVDEGTTPPDTGSGDAPASDPAPTE